jgi:hypothetical protein
VLSIISVLPGPSTLLPCLQLMLEEAEDRKDTRTDKHHKKDKKHRKEKKAKRHKERRRSEGKVSHTLK